MIVEQARAIGLQAIMPALPPRTGGTTLFGKTVETVLAEPSCRVVIESRPAAVAAGPPLRSRR